MFISFSWPAAWEHQHAVFAANAALLVKTLQAQELSMLYFFSWELLSPAFFSFLVFVKA